MVLICVIVPLFVFALFGYIQSYRSVQREFIRRLGRSPTKLEFVGAYFSKIFIISLLCLLIFLSVYISQEKLTESFAAIVPEFLHSTLGY